MAKVTITSVASAMLKLHGSAGRVSVSNKEEGFTLTATEGAVPVDTSDAAFLAVLSRGGLKGSFKKTAQATGNALSLKNREYSASEARQLAELAVLGTAVIVEEEKEEERIARLKAESEALEALAQTVGTEIQDERDAVAQAETEFTFRTASLTNGKRKAAEKEALKLRTALEAGEMNALEYIDAMNALAV